MSQQVSQMIELAIKACDASLSGNERDQLDKTFQQKLKQYTEMTTKSANELNLNPKNPMEIDISSQGQHYQFNIDLTELNRLSPWLDMKTAPEYHATLLAITEKIKVNLPDSEFSMQWPMVAEDNQSSCQQGNVVRINSDDNQKHVIKQLVEVRSQLLTKFSTLADIVQRYIDEQGAGDTDFDYHGHFLTLIADLGSMNLLGNVSLFENNHIRFQHQSKQVDYEFPVLRFSDQKHLIFVITYK